MSRSDAGRTPPAKARRPGWHCHSLGTWESFFSFFFFFSPFLFIRLRGWLLRLSPCLGLFTGFCLPHKSASGTVWCQVAFGALSRTRTFLYCDLTIHEAGKSRVSWGVLGSALWVLPLCPSPRMASGGVSFPPPTPPLQSTAGNRLYREEYGLGIGSLLAKTSVQSNEDMSPYILRFRSLPDNARCLRCTRAREPARRFSDTALFLSSRRSRERARPALGSCAWPG